MQPFRQNLLSALATVVYVKTVVGGCDLLVSRNVLPSKVSRKIVHVAAGSWILFWNYFTQDHWTWRLNILVPAVYSIQLFVQGAIIKNPNDKEVKTMTRSGNPIELLFGPLFFTLIMNLVGLLFFKQEIGIMIMACLGYGDGIAPLIGTYFPFGAYRTWPFGANDQKTLSGSIIGFFGGSLIGYLLLRSAILGIPDADNWNAFIPIAIMATVTEGISGQWDNIGIPAVVYYVYNHY